MNLLNLPWRLVPISTLDAQADARMQSAALLSAALDRAVRAEAHADRVDGMIRDLEGRHERAIVATETRYAELMKSYHSLRLQGFLPVVDVPRDTKHPDPVTTAINRASKGDPDLRRKMLAQSEIDRVAGLTPVEIVARIERGNRPAEDMA